MSEPKPSNLVGKDVNPESLQRPQRRIFRREQKMAILDEIDASPDKVGLIPQAGGHIFFPLVSMATVAGKNGKRQHERYS
jgi:hypothetical protein